jgi:type VII secretion protein EccE
MPAGPPQAGALFAPRPTAPTAAPGPPPQGGVIGARPAAAAPPPPEPAEGLLQSRAAAPPIAVTPAPGRTAVRTDARAAQASQAAAARRALSVASAATITPPTGRGWSDWQASALAVAPETAPPTGHPGRPHAPIKPSTAWVVHAGQIVALQLAVIGVLVGLQRPLTFMIPLLIGAVILFALTVPRHDGRWAYQWLGIWLRYVLRRRHRTMTAGGSIGELLRPFLRGIVLDTIEVDDAEKMLLTQAGGLTMLVEATPEGSSMFVESGVTVPPPTALLPPGEEGGAPISAQVVVQTTPAPGAYRADGVVAHSYQALGQGMIPAHRRSWIALQALRTPGDSGTDDADLRASLLNAVARLQRRLRRSGIRATVLDGTQLTADLVALSGAETVPRADGAPAVQLNERWKSWSAGSHAQVVYRLLEWPDLGTHAGREFFDRLATLSSVMTTVGLSARRVVRPPGKSAEQNDLELEAVLRLTVPADQVQRLRTQLDALARRHGVRLQRMNGEQAFGVAASLPLGGFVI